MANVTLMESTAIQTSLCTFVAKFCPHGSGFVTDSER